MSSAGRGFRGWSQESLEGSGRSGNGGREGETRSGSRDQKAQISSSRIEEDLFLRSEEVARVEEEARKIGYEAGYAEGFERARADMEPLRQAWLDWASRMHRFEDERLRGLLPVLVEILDKALQKVLGEEEDRPKILRKLLERMVGDYASGREGELLVAESDYQVIARSDPGFPEELATRGIRLGVGPDLLPRHVELRFADRIVSFDPAFAGGSLRRTLSRVNPGPINESPGGNEGEVHP